MSKKAKCSNFLVWHSGKASDKSFTFKTANNSVNEYVRHERAFNALLFDHFNSLAR